MKQIKLIDNNDHTILGSDYLPCDGRWSIPTCLAKGREYALRMKKNIHPSIKAFTLVNATLRNPDVILYKEIIQ